MTDDIATRLAAAGLRVKPLEWFASKVPSWDNDWHTVPTAYTIRCADENGWKWTGAYGGFGYVDFRHQAKPAADADHVARILSQLEATE